MCDPSDPCESTRARIGLNDDAAKSLRNHKINKRFDLNIKSRNEFSKYSKLWETWPGTIDVSGDPTGRVNGCYKKLSCQHTVVLSALWSRQGAEETSPMYLFFRPNVLRAGLDVAVFAPTPSYADGNEVMELVDWIPENALDPKTHETRAELLQYQDASSLKVEVPDPTMAVVTQTEAFHDRVLADLESLRGPILCEMVGLSKEVILSLLEYNETDDDNDFTKMDLFGKNGTRNAQRLNIVAAPSLLKCAAQDELPLSFATWYNLPTSVQYGKCQMMVPRRPVEKWRKKSADTMERYYDPEESNEYYQVSLAKRS